MEKSPSTGKRKTILVDALNRDDYISRLSNDLLVNILSRLSTEESMRTSTLSERWLHVWKETPFLFLDMRWKANDKTLLSDITRSMTKVIKDHCGRLESCTIYHYSYQYYAEMLDSWIQSLVHVKHTKQLSLVNFFDRLKPSVKSNITLNLPPKCFAHENLDSIVLGGYILKAPHAFNNCWNLKNLKLVGIFAEIEVFNAVLVYCPSIELLLLQITCHKRSGILKIKNQNLKFLFLSCSKIDGIEVSSPNLDILAVGSLSCEIENFVIVNPRLQFNRNYFATAKLFPHTSYYISCPYQENKSIGHEFMLNEAKDCMIRFASMSVSVNLTIIKEVEMFREVLVSWHGEMGELEISFRNENIHGEQGESSIGRTRKQFMEEAKPFPNAYFRVYNLWLSNFSNTEEQFALASQFITQGTVIRTMIIKPSSFSPNKKLEIQAAVARLRELPKGHKELGIVMF